jgi:gluconate 5-dehydrogenase
LRSHDYLGGLFDLSGRRALITGSGRGLGLAFARALGSAGASVVLNARNTADLEVAAAALRAAGLTVSHRAFDVTRSEEIDAAVADIEASEGPIDILVNNAGIQHRGPLEQFADADWDRLMGVNLGGTFRTSRAVVRSMIARKRGAIVNIASVQSELARPSIAPYSASKGAIRMLTKAMAGEWGTHGIRVNALAPGYFRTDLNAALAANEEFSGWLEKRTPMRRWGDVDELAGAIIFLASDASSFMTGQTMFVDGGITSVL